MKSLIKIFIFLLLPFFAKAQSLQSEIDSLHIELQLAKNDTARLNIYRSLCSSFDDVIIDSAVYYGNEALKIAQKLQLKFNEAREKSLICWPLSKMGNYPRVFKMANEALDFFENPKNENYLLDIPIGETPRSYRLMWLSSTYSAFAYLHYCTGNYEKSISISQEAIRIGESVNDTVGLADVYSTIAEQYFTLNKLDSALYYCKKSLSMYSVTTYKKYLSNIYVQIGDIYYKKGDLSLAKEYFNKAIQASILYKNTVQLGEAHIRLANLYRSQNQIDSSLYNGIKALNALTFSGKDKSLIIAYRIISDNFGLMGNEESSFAYLKSATLLNDKVQKAEKEKMQEFQEAAFEETLKVQELEKEKIRSQNKIRTYGMLGGIAILSVIGFILYRNNRKVKKAKAIIEKTLSELKSTQSLLIQSEKMASLGELTAGIAHEIQNPMNFVNNFSEVSIELLDELKSELHNDNKEEALYLADELIQNMEKIVHHGKRADSIVKGMLQHSRSSSGIKELTDINALCDEYLRLSYHGLRAKDKSFNANLKSDFDPSAEKIEINPQDMGRAILNIITNAFYAVNQKKNSGAAPYDPTVTISTKRKNDHIEIKVSDNGNGIPDHIKEKIFQPFFTTKPTGQGTGLGLSLTYDIIKAHGGSITVETSSETGTTFIITI
jgi:two-component system, NtrC family, sensor kinase